MLRSIKQGVVALFVAAIFSLLTSFAQAGLVYETSNFCKNVTSESSSYFKVLEEASALKQEVEIFLKLEKQYRMALSDSWELAQQAIKASLDKNEDSREPDLTAANEKLREVTRLGQKIITKGRGVMMSSFLYLGLLSELCPEFYVPKTHRAFSI